MRFISLFSGIGGFDLGFQRAGMECAGMVEIDKPCQEVLRRQFPGVPIYDDVREVGKKTHERGSIDLICGGFPCQDVSVAGKRAGIAGERSGLWYEFARIIDEIEPAWVVIENVPGLLSSNKGRDFAVILQWLAQRGYGVAWRVLDAQYFGVAQRRRRVFVVASFGDGRAAEVLFEREGGPGVTQPRREAGEDVAPTIGGVSNGGGANGPGRDVDSITSLVVVMAHGQANAEIVIDCSPSLTLNREAPIVFNCTPLVGVRRLMPIECERLQGFPDGWTDGQPDTRRYRQLGNAVAVPVTEWLGRRIVGVE